MTATPLLTRIAERRDQRVGAVCPVPKPSRMSEFSRRLAEKRLPVHELYNGAFVPRGDRGAA